MTTATSSLAHKFQVNSVAFQSDTNTRINIKKRREQVVFKTLSSEDNINISYLISPEITPSNNLVISDRSTTLTQNRTLATPTVNKETTQTLNLSVGDFLITDVFTTATPTQEATPLFYVHTLTNFNSDMDDFSNLTLLAIEFADYTFSHIELSEYSVDTSTGKVYNNIENEYDADNQTLTATFIKYTVRDSSTSDVYIYHELISNEQVFQQADFDDIDAFGNLISTVKKYLKEQLPGLQNYLITLPQNTLYAYKETPNSRIRVIEPVAVDLSNPWYLRVSNGEFISSQEQSDNTFKNYKYHLAEFNSQTFFPYPPYKLQAEQRATWLYDNLIYVPKNVVHDSTLGLYVDVIIQKNDETLRYAYSNDPDKIGTVYQTGTNYTDGILSIDKLNGIIEVDNKVEDTDIVSVSYYTSEDQYEFTSVDLNPIDNIDILNQRVVLYVNPETSSTGELDSTLEYLVVDNLGKITYASQPAGGGVDPATTKMLSEDFFTTGAATHDFYYDIESSASGLLYRASGINLAYRDDFSFIDKYTVDSVLLNTSVASGIYADQNIDDNPRFLVLADVYVGEGSSPDSITEFDVRVQGGGIKEDDVGLALAQNSEVAWYWDMNSRRPYPACGAFMAEVPQTIMSDHGGSFSRDEVVEVIERHMKMGGYAIVDTYGIDPAIISSSTTSGTIDIAWPTYGSDVSYNVYYSLDNDIGFSGFLTSVPDNAGGNSATITGLTSSTKYYVKVGAVDSDGDESFSKTISAITKTAIS